MTNLRSLFERQIAATPKYTAATLAEVNELRLDAGKTNWLKDRIGHCRVYYRVNTRPGFSAIMATWDDRLDRISDERLIFVEMQRDEPVFESPTYQKNSATAARALIERLKEQY